MSLAVEQLPLAGSSQQNLIKNAAAKEAIANIFAVALFPFKQHAYAAGTALAAQDSGFPAAQMLAAYQLQPPELQPPAAPVPPPQFAKVETGVIFGAAAFIVFSILGGLFLGYYVMVARRRQPAAVGSAVGSAAVSPRSEGALEVAASKVAASV